MLSSIPSSKVLTRFLEKIIHKAIHSGHIFSFLFASFFLLIVAVLSFYIIVMKTSIILGAIIALIAIVMALPYAKSGFEYIEKQIMTHPDKF